MISRLKFFLRSRHVERLRAVMAGAILGQGLVVLISPLLTRLYTPAEFGVLSFYANIFGILAVAASLRLELAIPGAKTPKDATSLVVLAIMAGLAAAVVSVPVLWLAAPSIGQSVRPYLWTIPVGIIAFSASNALIAWTLYYRQYRMIGRMRLSQGVVTAGLQLAWPAISPGPLGMILGTMLSQGGGVVSLGGKLIASLRRRPALAAPSTLLATLSAYRIYPQFALPASLIARVAVHLPMLLFLTLYGETFAGLLLLSQRLVGVPTVLLARTMAAPMQQEIGAAHRNGRSTRRVVLSTIALLSVPGIAMAAVIVLLGPWLFETVFGSDWRVAGGYAQMLAPMFFLQLIATPFAQIQSVTGNPRLQILMEATRLAVISLAVLGPYAAALPMKQCVMIYSVASSFIYIMYIVGALLKPSNRIEQ